MRPEIQRRLRLSSEQIELIGAAFEQGRQATLESAKLPPGAKPVSSGLSVKEKNDLLKSKDFDEQVENVRKQVAKTRSATMRGIAELLNKTQREAYEKMLGAKFEFPKRREQPERD